jgi:hypothetical protein
MNLIWMKWKKKYIITMDKKQKELLYQKLNLILQLVEDHSNGEAIQHLEELIHRIQFNKI